MGLPARCASLWFNIVLAKSRAKVARPDSQVAQRGLTSTDPGRGHGHELHLAVTLQPSNRLAHCLLCRDIATICVGSFVRVLAEHLARLLSQFLENRIVDEDISEPTHPVERCVEDRLQAHRAFPLTVCRSEKRGKIDAEYCPELGI